MLVATFLHRKLLASQTDWFGYIEKFYMCRRGCKREKPEGLSTWQHDQKKSSACSSANKSQALNEIKSHSFGLNSLFAVFERGTTVKRHARTSSFKKKGNDSIRIWSINRLQNLSTSLTPKGLGALVSQHPRLFGTGNTSGLCQSWARGTNSGIFRCRSGGTFK